MERYGDVEEPEKRIVCEKTIFQRNIHGELVFLKEGISALIYGGDKSHIGAVSIIGADGQLTTTVFPKHRDDTVSDAWARELYNRYRCPVVVSAGIHFDKLTRGEIEEILTLSSDMLQEICNIPKEEKRRK